jgi:hypothetical protein
MDRQLYNLKESAGILGISRASLYGLINRGELETVHIRARHLVPEKSIAAFIARLTGDLDESA